MSLEIRTNYIAYDQPKMGVFRVEHPDGLYDIKIGWLRVEEKIKIIGEDENSYVYRIIETEYGEWIEGKVIKQHFLSPIGVHKSRLVRWEATQLALF